MQAFLDIFGGPDTARNLALLLLLVWVLGWACARRGWFRGDLFVSCSVVACALLLLLFIAYPVSKTLFAAFLTESGQFSPNVAWQRFADERIWGLSCLRGSGGRCGVAWNTLLLALLTATSTTLLGTGIALLAERSASRAKGLFGVLAVLPIITPPFVVGLGLILLFGRAGVVNQWLEWGFGIEPTRWFYGLFGVWLAQTFAFAPIAYLIMRGVVQGVSPSLEEAAQTLRASPTRTFTSVTFPLLKPGLANAFLVGFIESMADFGNPIVVGGSYSVLSTDIFFAIVGAQYDQSRAATLAWVLSFFALTVFALQRALLGKQNFTTVSGKGDSGLPLPLPPGLRRSMGAVVRPWLLFTMVVYAFAFAGGFVKTWGRDYSFTLEHFKTAFELDWGAFGVVWAGSAWNSFWTTLKLAAISAPLTAGLGLLIAYLLARTKFKGQGAFEFAALLAFAIPGTVLGVSYILAFNVPPFELTGTAFIIVLCFMFRNLPVGVRAGTAAFKQLDASLDEASIMLRAQQLANHSPRDFAPAQARFGGRLDLQFCARHHHGERGHLFGHCRKRVGHHLHHWPRGQWRLWRGPGLLQCAHCAHGFGHGPDSMAGGRTQTGAAQSTARRSPQTGQHAGHAMKHHQHTAQDLHHVRYSI
jgi:iron(III) transport system permease protein